MLFRSKVRIYRFVVYKKVCSNLLVESIADRMGDVYKRQSQGFEAWAGDDVAFGVSGLPGSDLPSDLCLLYTSGQGFKFAFPNAVSDPDVNPFADQMVAVDASTVDAALTVSVISTCLLYTSIRMQTCT